MRCQFVMPSVAALLMSMATLASAQLNSGSGNFGGMSGGSLGGASSGGSSAGRSGSSASSSSGLFGARSLGGASSAGKRTFGAGSTGSQGPQGALDANSRFVRGNRRTGQFVGSDAGEGQNFVGALTGGANGRNNNNLGNLNRNNNNVNNFNRQSQNQSDVQDGRLKYRPALRVGFEYPLPPPDKLSSTVSARMAKVKRLGPIAVSIEGRTATLTGTVATAHDRELAAQFALLEAGISQVQNDLVVDPSTAPVSTAPVSTGPASTGPASTGPASTAPASTAPSSSRSPTSLPSKNAAAPR